MNPPIADTMTFNEGDGGFKASLDWANSYRWDDQLRVRATSAVCWPEKLAKADLFNHMFAELLLRAPGPVVQILPTDFADPPGAANRIGEKVRELQGAPLLAWLIRAAGATHAIGDRPGFSAPLGCGAGLVRLSLWD